MKYNTKYHGVIDLDNISKEDFLEITGKNLVEERKQGRYLTHFGSSEDAVSDKVWQSKRTQKDIERLKELEEER